MAVRKKRKGTAIDWAFALALMLIAVTVSVYYVGYLTAPRAPFIAPLETQALELAEKIDDAVSWDVYTNPVIIDSPETTAWPIEIFLKEENLDSNSTIILDSAKNELPSQFDDQTNDTIWLADLSSGKNVFYLVFTKETNLAARNYSGTTYFEKTGSTIRNSLLNVTFATAGISSLQYNGQEFLSGSGVDLGTTSLSGIDNATNGTMRVKAKWTAPAEVTAKVYANSSKILIEANESITVDMRLSNYFTSFYNGSANDFNETGLISQGILDFVDVYNATGLAVIGDNMNVSVYNENTYRRIVLTDVSGFELFAHAGTWTGALSERDMFFDTKITVGVPVATEGISNSSLQAMAAKNYTTLKEELYVVGLDFKAQIGNTNFGIDVPEGRDVVVINHPMVFINRFGNASLTNFSLAVWIGG